MDKPAPQPISRADVASWYLKAGHRRVWVVPLSVVLAVFVVFLVLRRMAQDPHANLEESRKLVLALQRDVPDEKNALVAVVNSWTLRTPQSQSTDINWLVALSFDRSLLKNSEYEEFWQAIQPEMKALKEALSIEDASAKLSPEELSQGKNWVRFAEKMRLSAQYLALDARMQALNGQHDGAVASLKAVQRLGFLYGRDGPWISRMMGLSMETIPEDDFWTWLLNELPPLDNATLRKYQNAIDRSNRVFESLERATVYERAFSLYNIDTAVVAQHKPGAPAVKSGVFDGIVYGAQRAAYDRILSEFIAVLQRKQAPLENVFKKDELRSDMAYMPKSFERTFEAEAKGHNLRLLVYCALAVQQYQNTYGRDPKNLEELVPEFMAEVPKDCLGHPVKLIESPFDENSRPATHQHTITRSKLSLKLYSIGIDGKDDDGTWNYELRGDKVTKDDQSLYLRGTAARGKAP